MSITIYVYNLFSNYFKFVFEVERLEMQKRGLQEQITLLKKEVGLLKEDLSRARTEISDLEETRLYIFFLRLTFKLCIFFVKTKTLHSYQFHEQNNHTYIYIFSAIVKQRLFLGC